MDRTLQPAQPSQVADAPLPLARAQRWLWPTLAAALLLLLLRKPDALLQPYFWAEDAAVFFRQQYLLGAAALWEPYAGYLHLVPRLLALAAELMGPPAWAPALYHAGAGLVTLGVVALVFDRRVDLPFKPLAALAIVAAPYVAGEILLNLTNVQWVTALGLLLLLMKTSVPPASPEPRWRRGLDALLIVLFGLTGPFSVLMAPLFALWVAARPSRDALWRLALLAGTAALQAAFILTAPAASGVTVASTGVFTPDAWALLGGVMGTRLFGGAFVPAGVAPMPGGLLLAASVTLWVLLPWLAGARRASVALVLCTGLLIGLAGVFKARGELAAMAQVEYGPRYFFVAHVGVVWALLAAADSPRLPRLPRRAVVALLLLAWVSTAASLRWQAPRLPDLHWPAQAQAIGREAVSIPIHPQPWRLELPARPAPGPAR